LEPAEQEVVGATLEEGHLPALHLGDLGPVGVVEPDPAADIRERERQPGVAASAHDDAIQLGHPIL